MSRSVKILLLALAPLLLWNCGGRGEVEFHTGDIPSPVVFAGDSLRGWRDPAALLHEGRVHLFFTGCEIVGDTVYTCVMHSKSGDLVNWSEPRRITEARPEIGYSNPGNVVWTGEEWVMCLQSYPRPGYTVDQMPRYGEQSARIYLMRSKDLREWSAPELMKLAGDVPVEDMGRMTNPFLIRDKDEKEKWWCFYKHAGLNMSYSYDLVNWTPSGASRESENVCIIVDGSEYVMFNSPPGNGIEIKKSRTLENWAHWGSLITLGQDRWEWARGRVSGASVLHMPKLDGAEGYLMFFCGSGPLTEEEGDFDRNASIGVAWSRDLLEWNWPGKSSFK